MDTLFLWRTLSSFAYCERLTAGARTEPLAPGIRFMFSLCWEPREKVQMRKIQGNKLKAPPCGMPSKYPFTPPWSYTITTSKCPVLSEKCPSSSLHPLWWQHRWHHPVLSWEEIATANPLVPLWYHSNRFIHSINGYVWIFVYISYNSALAFWWVVCVSLFSRDASRSCLLSSHKHWHWSLSAYKCPDLNNLKTPCLYSGNGSK